MEILNCLGWRLLPLPACGTGVPSSTSHNPWHFGTSEGFELLTQPPGSVVISVLSDISTFGVGMISGEGRREVCAFPSCLQGIGAASGVPVILTGLGKVPTSSSLSCVTLRAGLEPWLLGLDGGFSLRLLEVHCFSPKYHLFLLPPVQVTRL